MSRHLPPGRFFGWYYLDLVSEQCQRSSRQLSAIGQAPCATVSADCLHLLLVGRVQGQFLNTCASSQVSAGILIDRLVFIVLSSTSAMFHQAQNTSIQHATFTINQCTILCSKIMQCFLIPRSYCFHRRGARGGPCSPTHSRRG